MATPPGAQTFVATLPLGLSARSNSTYNIKFHLKSYAFAFLQETETTRLNRSLMDKD